MKCKLSAAIGTALLAISGSAVAITDSDVNSVIPFNFANPGARSLGMGGAFLALADDATAAYTNPAGLTQLLEPEISVEGRHTKYSVPFINGGTFSLDPFNTSGLNSAEANNSVNNLSFISVSFPHDRWAFAFYRNETLRYDNTLAGSLDPETGEIPGQGTLDVFPIGGSESLKIVDYGASAAFRINDSVSIGAGLSYYKFDIDTAVARVADSQFFTNPGELLNGQVQNGSDSDVAFNLGARFVFNDQWSAALAFRRGAEFSYDASAVATAQIVDNGDGTSTAVAITPTLLASLKDVKMKVPDVYGAGLSWRPNDAWRVNFDIDRVMYSQVTRDMQSVFGFGPSSLARLTIPNGNEYHVGAEYTFAQMSAPVSLRAGVWRDPAHSIRYRGDPATDPDFATNVNVVASAVVFSAGKGSQTHYAFGGGVAFKQFQLDFGADFSDLVDTYSISAVWRF